MIEDSYRTKVETLASLLYQEVFPMGNLFREHYRNPGDNNTYNGYIRLAEKLMTRGITKL